MSHYWNQLYRLKIIKRWGTSITIEPESVAEHSYYVAIAAYMLAKLDEMLNGTSVDKECLLIKALRHDEYECYTAHIVSPIKHHTTEIGTVFQILAQDYHKTLNSLVPIEQYNEGDEVNNNSSAIDIYIDIADAIDAYCYCALQVYLGNKDFNNKLSLMRKKVVGFSIKYNYVNEFIENLFDENDFETIY